ncbi:MAG: bifunctional adenosylcobinamide hydrolase/alpha-ribazole phosphatase CbiS [archaeon]|nr:bifunctional adenosylcobinamide hydrolase/alpha-ribazole phosphatase CbiS [archaeon]
MKYVKCTEVHEEDNFEATAVIRFTEKMEILSSAPYNGGSHVTDTVFIMQVPHDFSCMDYISVLKNKIKQYSLPDDAVGFMTSAEVRYVFSKSEDTVDDATTFVAATAGVTNCVVAGEPLTDWEQKKERSAEIYRKLVAGTINIVAVCPYPLSEAGKINAFIPLVEGKTLAMRDRGYVETGTTSDAMAIVCPIGDDRIEFTGTGTPVGQAIAKGVRRSVFECLRKRGESAEAMSSMQMFSKHGVTLEQVWECASACGLDESLHEEFDNVFESMGTDPDICALVYATVAAGTMADKNCICNQMEGELPDVLVDGTFAMFLAGRISETRGSDATVDLLRMRPLRGNALPEYTEYTVYGLVAGVVGYITGFSDE